MDSFSCRELFWAEVPRKIHLAREIYDRLGKTMLVMTRVRQHLDGLARGREKVSRLMDSSNLPELCGFCGRTSLNGGCCSRYMAAENDSILLLINLLAGAEVQEYCLDGIECTFLGTKGCSLEYKPIFCLNYLCTRIKKNTPPSLLASLEKATGNLLQMQYATEQLLLATLRSHRCLH